MPDRGVNFQAHHASPSAVAAHENPLCLEPGPGALRPRWPCPMLPGLARRKASRPLLRTKRPKQRQSRVAF
ncbi:MAG: hypothetical protein EBY28_11860 [Betaproteobacteria bacterium]|nr:hypothetical protein [Betaproteobacteria bacterium]